MSSVLDALVAALPGVFNPVSLLILGFFWLMGLIVAKAMQYAKEGSISFAWDDVFGGFGLWSDADALGDGDSCGDGGGD